MTRLLSLLIALGALGCGTEPESSVAGLNCVGGIAPALTACDTGLYWADCGGTGTESVLGCSESNGACWWFFGGCVAEGMRRSACPTDDVCCVPRETGHSPFEEPFTEFGPAPAQVVEDLATLTGPVDLGPSPMDLEVVIDPALVVSEAVVTCSRTDVEGCGPRGFFAPTPLRFGSDAVVRAQAPMVWVTTLDLAITPDGSGGVLRARAYYRMGNDAAPPGEPVCERARTPSGTSLGFTGTLRLNAAPDLEDLTSLHGEADLERADGLTIHVTF